MARRRGSGIGCGTLLFVVVLAVAVWAWRLGYVDRLLYTFALDQGVAGISAEESARIDGELQGCYVYSTLPDADRELYRTVYDSFRSREPRTYPETTMDDLARIRDYVLADHPELFYVNGVRQLTSTNSGSGLVTGVTVEAQYAYDEAESAALLQQVEAEAYACLAGIPDDADDYGKAKYLYEYLAAATEYDHAAAAGVLGGDAGGETVAGSTGQTVVDALVRHSAVCGGYASAYQYLLQELGIQCAYITGEANGGRHAWCVALLDGDYYFVDPTWGDPEFVDATGAAPAEAAAVNYDYLCVTTGDIGKTHVLSSSFDVPVCTAVADNYYVREGLLFDWADAERFGALAADAFARADSVQVRCADAAVYDELLHSCVETGDIAYYLPDADRYRYTYSDDFLTIALYPAW